MRSLDAHDLSKTFGGNRAVNGVSLSLAPGELVALIGPNGAGKSTLLNLLTGQHVPDSGRVLLGEQEITKCSPSSPLRRTVIRTYQDGGTFLRLSALENVMVPAVARGVPRKRAAELASTALTRLGLERIAHTRADRLSGGQRKLIDFGRSLVVDAQLALLDEPTAGVSPVLMDRLGDVISQRRDEGGGFLLVSHDLPWAFSLCSRVVVMAAGQVLTEGTAEQVRNDDRVKEAYLA